MVLTESLRIEENLVLRGRVCKYRTGTAYQKTVAV